MPTTLPRLNVTVTQHQHRLLAELGALQGRSSASYLREMLDASTPMLEAMLPVYRAAAAQAAMQPEALQTAIRDALANLDTNRAQLDLLRLLSASEANSANDAGASTGPSGAREDDAPAARQKRS